MVVGPLCIMLFGIYFPERAKFDFSYPWIKWTLIGLLASLLPLALIYNFGFAFSFEAIRWLAPAILMVFRGLTISAMIAICIYFYCLGQKAATATSPDTRRRLRILYIGSTIGNLPLFLLVLYSIFSDRDIGAGVPPYLVLTAFFFFTLFPISLAYVVVVHRAMDLRIMLRQGTKYALARTSLWFIRAFSSLLLGLAIVHAMRSRPVRWQDALLVASLAALLIVVRLRTTKVLSAWIDKKFFREAYSASRCSPSSPTRRRHSPRPRRSFRPSRMHLQSPSCGPHRGAPAFRRHLSPAICVWEWAGAAKSSSQITRRPSPTSIW